MEFSKPKILVLGGCGFVGRNFVHYCVKNELCSQITVADKSLPEISFMNDYHEESFNNDIVKYIQSDLAKDNHLDRVFNDKSYDYVFNLAAETRYGLPDSTYDERCTKLSKKCALKSKEIGVKKFIEVSTALVYKPQSKNASREDFPTAPWTEQSTAKLKAEEEVLAVEGLDIVILRPAFIYGIGDTSGLMPRIVCAAAYVELKEKMKFLWDSNMKINTVHVNDVCLALIHVAWGAKDKGINIPNGSIYNLCDKNDTNQGKMNEMLGKLFNISTGFHGIIISNVARLNFTVVVDGANEKHMVPWDAMCRKHQIFTTPLSPYISKELLSNTHLFVDGSKIEHETQFQYTIPKLTLNTLQEQIEAAIDINIFPSILHNK